MGKANVCLKICFISLATLIGIISALLLALLIYLHGYTGLLLQDEHGEIIVVLVLLYTLAVSTVILSIFGVYGAAKEKQWALILFAAGMGIASLLTFVDLGKSFPARNQIIHSHREAMSQMDPFQLYHLQMTLKCCGLENGYQDWGSDVPESCLCDQDGSVACVEAVWNATHAILDDQGKPMTVYAQPCSPILLAQMTSGFDAVIGTCFGLVFLWGVSVCLSVAILRQLRKNVELPPVTYSAEGKAGQYTTLCDTAEIIREDVH